MRFLRFLSLTTATQLVLLANQLLILPLQLRSWGQDVTAQWAVVLAVAYLSSVADLGLRNAGHAEIVASQRGDEAASRTFAAVWALTRLLFVIATLVLIVVSVRAVPNPDAGAGLWVGAIVIAFSLDTLLIVRGIWLDTLGHFNRVEGVFLALVASRVLLSVIALTFFDAGPSVLAWITLITAVAALLTQLRLLGQTPDLDLLAAGFELIRWRTLAMVRWVVAEPASNWVRLMLPVIVLSTFAKPAVVTSYVGLRAVFGLSRQVVNQVSRFASVRFIQTKESSPDGAEAFALRAVLFCTVLSVAGAAPVIADRGRVLGIWLKGSDPALIGMISASLAVGAVAYGYQVVTGALIRSGAFIEVASRQYLYLAIAGAAALIGAVAGSTETYLVLLAIAELAIATLFVGALGRRLCIGALIAFASSGVWLTLLWYAASVDLGQVFTPWTLDAALWSILAAGLAALLSAVTCCAVGFALAWRAV